MLYDLTGDPSHFALAPYGGRVQAKEIVHSDVSTPGAS
jgi:hypothetical protein